MPIFASEQSWVVETEHSAYALGLTKTGRLVHCYWGTRLPWRTDYPAPVDSYGWASFDGPSHLAREEYPAHGGPMYVEPCLRVLFADGVRDLVLNFVDAELTDETLQIHLHDEVYPLQVTLHYRAYAELDLIERWVTLRNTGTEPIVLERVFSARWHLPRGTGYRWSYLSGRWSDEMHLTRETLNAGSKVLESRRLTTGHQHNPWFAVDRGQADEDSGEVWSGALLWSGNWKMVAETTTFASTCISLGLNDWDFAWRLEPGLEFQAPACLAGYTRDGFGGASRQFHDFVRTYAVPHPAYVHQVLYNSWEATGFAVNEQEQLELARQAAALGVELFVMDDGWFTGRVADTAGLGDWQPDPVKFPHGLDPLITGVKALGMDFGLWIEPEMVNRESNLYRTHPDWVIHFPTRHSTEMRHQLILNMGRADVQQYVIEQLDALLTHHAIRFIKWDMNRNVSEPGWPNAPGEPREIWVRYVQGLYHVWDTLRARHPEVIWQSCSGGGGRADLAILRRADQIWVSDNTEATARLRIQDGFSQVFPASTMEAWVTDAGQQQIPLLFRFHASMCGVLGIGGNLLNWNQTERNVATRAIAQYKELRHIIQAGDLYRLRSPLAHAYAALSYITKDRTEGLLFVFRTYLPDPVELPPIYLRGLDPLARYRIEGLTEIRSGLGWMQTGVQLAPGNFESMLLRIQQV